MKMGASLKNILLLTFLVVFCDLASAQSFCAKIDFNRTIFPEFRECQGNFQKFVIREYGMGKDVKPYRTDSKYFLTNDLDKYSCAESNIRLSINPSTTIEAAIYLKSAGGAFVEINIYDVDRNARVDTLRNEGTSGWFILKKNMETTIPNARVSIRFSRIQMKITV